jgi:CheY-like chemotaxis protein
MTTPAEHLVQFYDRDEDLFELVTKFIHEGLTRHERVIVLTSATHWLGVRARFDARPDSPLPAALDSGALVVRETADLEARVIVDDRVDVQAFRNALTELIAGADRFRVFGDFVSSLAERGMMDAALEIERLGHELAHGLGAPVLCAYDVRPLHGPAVVSRIADAHDRTIATAAPSGGGPVVLLADDFADARELYKVVLELSGFSVVTAEDGAEAVEAARRDHPALIVLDIRMPRMSGLDAMRTLKGDADMSRTPMIALTAHAFPADQSMLLAEGFDAVLAKPCSPDTLTQTVESLLGISSRS